MTRTPRRSYARYALRRLEPRSISLVRPGPRCAAGVDSIVKTDELAILGLWEIGQALPKFWRAFGELKRAAIDRKPDAVVLVDWPDFNLRLARWLHRRGVRVIYYISPQLWAWRSYRVHSVQRDVDLLLSILPFEKEWYAARGMTQVEYVGHPLTGEVRARYGREEFVVATTSTSRNRLWRYCRAVAIKNWCGSYRQCLTPPL